MEEDADGGTGGQVLEFVVEEVGDDAMQES
jgi:hypothetical protein